MAEPSQSLVEEYLRLLAVCAPAGCLHLRFGDVIVQVVSNSPALMVFLSAYFRGFVCAGACTPDIRIDAIDGAELRLPYAFTAKQPDPGKTKIKEEYVDVSGGRIVRKRLTGMVFLFGGGMNMAAGPCLANANQVVNFINNRYIQHRLNRGYLLGHAAAVRLEDTGIAVAGLSGAGKSTLALHGMSAGATFISNDRLLIAADGDGVRMSGVAKLPRINPGTALNNSNLAGVIPPARAAAFRSLPEAQLWDLEHKYDVYIEETFGPGRFELFGSLDVLVVLTWKRHDAPCAVTPVDIGSRPDLLRAFIKSPGLFYEPGPAVPADSLSADAYSSLLRRCRVYEISGGINFTHAAIALQEMAAGRKGSTTTNTSTGRQNHEQT
jgi:HprK-related kinase B